MEVVSCVDTPRSVCLQVLMNQQSDQRALAELQVTKEANAREQSELETQLAAALASSQGMVAVDNELGQQPCSSIYTAGEGI